MPRWLKVLVALGLLAALAAGMDWQAVPQYLAQVSVSMAGLAFVVIALELIANAWKWSAALRLHDLRHPWGFLFRVCCMAYFFNNFMPSAIGGDVYRVYRTWPKEALKSPAVSAVLIERLVGLAAMLFNGAIGAALLFRSSELARGYLLLAAIGVAAASVAAGVLYFGGFSRIAALVRRFPRLEPLETNLRLIGRPRKEWGSLIAGSFVFQWLAALYVYFTFAAVGVELDVGAALLITAAAGIASVLPISISGIGVVEGSIAGTAVALGFAYEPALLAAILSRLLVSAMSAVCGLFYLFDRPSATDLAAARQIT